MCKGTSYVSARFCLSDLEIKESDIRSIKHFLCQSDPKAIVECILANQAGCSREAISLSTSIKDTLANKVQSVLALVSQIEESAPKNSCLVVPWQWFHLPTTEESSKSFIGAALINFENIENLDENTKCYSESLLAFRSICSSMNEADIDVLFDRAVSNISCLRGISWPDLLGYQIWLPHSLTTAESSMVLSHIFWCMTYGGFGMDWLDPIYTAK